MKKILYFLSFSLLTLALVSCAKDEEFLKGGGANQEEPVIPGTALIVTGEIDNGSEPEGGDDTKLNFIIDKDSKTVRTTWREEDKIIGFDNKNNKFCFSVKSIDPETGKAIFEDKDYSVDEGVTTLYAIYAPGYEKKDIIIKDNSGELEIDLHEQNGSLDNDSQAYMCATGWINEGKVEFKFQNQTSIIAIEKMQTAANAELAKIKLYGVATTGKFSVEDNKIIFTPGTDVTGVTADVSKLDPKIVADGSGIQERHIYFVAVPTKKADLSLKLTDSNGNVYENTSTLVPGTEIKRSKYYHATKKLGIATVKDGSSEKVYYSLPDAVSAVNKATADATLTLFSDVTVTETQKISNENGRSITINLANKKIEGQSSPVLNIAGKVTLTAEDGGGVTSTGTGQAILVETDNTSLNIHGGTYEAKATYGTIRIYGGSSSTIENTVNVTIGENTKVLAKGAGKRAIYSGKDNYNAADLTINGGYFKSEEDVEAIFLAWGKATVNEGTFIGKYGLKRKGDPEKVECTINGGYFYGKGNDGAAIYISSDPGKANEFIFGGFFSSEPSDEWLATNYGKANTSFTDTEGNSYKWAVLTNNNALKSTVSTDADLTIAIEAAKKASGDYTISLQKDVALTAKTNKNYDIKGEGVKCAMYNIANENGNKITILLNGYTLTLPDYRSVITTTGNLEIKGGVVLGSRNRLFVLWDAGELNIENCLIQTSGTNYNVTVDSSAIVVHGLDADHPAGKISIKGTYIQTESNHRTSLVGVSHGKFEVKDSYLSIGGYGYHGIKVHQGAEVIVDNTSIYTPFTDPSSIPDEKTTWSASAILFQGTAKSVVVKGGSHLFGGTSSIRLGNGAGGGAISNLVVESGYFNTDIWNGLAQWKNIPEGNTWKQVPTQFSHKTKWEANYSDKSVNLDYDYQVSSK